MKTLTSSAVDRLARHLTDTIATVALLVEDDDGTGDIGIIVRQALRDDPTATARDIAQIVRDARADALAEAVRS
jgi:hypothetical protein